MPVLDQFELDFNPLPDTPPEPLPPTDPAAPLPPEVSAIIEQLWFNAREKESAMTARRIAEAIGFGPNGDRKVRAIIAQYQERMPFVIAGSPGQGFYITEDPEDMADYDRSLLSTLRSIASRARAFRINAARCGFDRVGTHPATFYRRRLCR